MFLLFALLILFGTVLLFVCFVAACFFLHVTVTLLSSMLRLHIPEDTPHSVSVTSYIYMCMHYFHHFSLSGEQLILTRCLILTCYTDQETVTKNPGIAYILGMHGYIMLE